MEDLVTLPSGLSWLQDRWRRLHLALQYALASLPVMAALTIGLGSWVTRTIEEQVINGAAVNAALYVQSVVAPKLQGLATRDSLAAQEIDEIEALLKNTALGKKLASFKVWRQDGKVVYYSRHDLIGRTFAVTENIRDAWRGEVRAEFGELFDDEDAVEAQLGVPLLETYSPVRQLGSNRVIAVAEFYQDGRELQAHLANTRLASWLVVALGTLATYGILFLIVKAGGETIRAQRELLGRRVKELSSLLEQNEDLRRRVTRATRRTTELNESFLRRVSADLHDGPAQAIGLVLLRLDALENELRPFGSTRDGEGPRDVQPLTQVRTVLNDALAEIRQISHGLALPELSELRLRDVVERAAQRHANRTGTPVALDVEALSEEIRSGLPLRLTAYRLVQESLMNAFRHAGGQGQRLRAWEEDGSVVLEISDTGGGFDAVNMTKDDNRLGLRGLRERVESLGGRFHIDSRAGKGTTLRAKLPLEGGL